MNIQELRDKRASLWEQMKALNEKSRAENRPMTSEEQNSWEKMDKEIDALDRQIAIEEKAEQRARQFAETNNPGVGRGTSAPPAPAAGEPPDSHREYRHTLRFTGKERVLFFDGPNRRATAEYEASFRRLCGVVDRTESRALQFDLDTAGGYTAPPEQFIARLIQAMDDAVFVRQNATVLQVTGAHSLGAPSLDADPADPDWTTELDTGTDDTAMKFGKRELNPKPLAKAIKVSKKLVRASALSIDALVRQRLAYKSGVAQEKGFLTGTGAGQPLGVFTASADGISTDRDVSDGNSTTAIKADGLINALYSLKSQYQDRAVWAFHRDAVKQIRKEKTGDGQYLWAPGLVAGQPNLILGRPFFQSEFVPNTFTTGKYVGIIGDWSFYWIAEALGLSIEILVELYARTNQNGYVLRQEIDGMPVLEEAFARVKLA